MLNFIAAPPDGFFKELMLPYLVTPTTYHSASRKVKYFFEKDKLPRAAQVLLLWHIWLC